MFTEKSGWVAAAALSLLLWVLWIWVPNDAISFQRSAIAGGQWWRMITGNLAHTNGWHLLLNLCGLWVLVTLFSRDLDAARLLLVLGSGALGVTIGIWLLCPQTQWYMGLSGALHGLFVWGLVRDLYFKRRGARLLLLGFAIKLLLDWQGGGENSPSAALIGARVHVGSHLLGSMAGLVLALVSLSWPARR
ncbi:rhombosortase [Aeromonas simiae]|uniref:Rhombosortase n=1 Tax=Aeromonas simiae TaxID=218936 RepID=A0A5J6WVZ3_9GAMM|nr:rhombosortase [Aeromonas simiae]QFI55092.1 rhombosortase [Aeromonas simiae]